MIFTILLAMQVFLFFFSDKFTITMDGAADAFTSKTEECRHTLSQTTLAATSSLTAM